MHVSLTEKLEKYAKSKVASGLYNNASEVIRESLRLMMQKDQDYERLKEAVTRGFQQIEEGNFTEVNSEEGFLAMARGSNEQG